MVGYMSLEEQVDADFSRARRRAFLRRLSARLRKDPTPNRLLCFEEVRRKVGAAGAVRRGRRTVCLTDIVGSVGQCSEFDWSFLPLRKSARTKWERIDRAFHRGEELPPVEHPGWLMDLNMLAITGGRERTARAFASLLERAGWRLERGVPTRSPLSVVLASAA